MKTKIVNTHVRLPASVAASIARVAAENRRSINAEIVVRLEQSLKSKVSRS